MKILDRYLLSKHLGPFVFSFVTITFLFVMRVLVRFLGLFVSRDLDPWTILEMFTLSLGWIFALTFPMSVFVAVVMAFGRLSQDSELDAIQASGISFLRLLAPILVAAGVLTVGLTYYNNAVLPNANHRLKTLRSDIQKMRPTIAIREGVFMDDFENYNLLVRKVGEDGRSLQDVTVYVLDNREPPQTIHAPRGEIVEGDSANRLVIRLYDGEIHQVDREDPDSYFLLNFTVHDLIFDDLGLELERRFEGGSRGDRELSVPQMQARIASLEENIESQTDSVGVGLDRALLALHGKIQGAVSDTSRLRPSELVSDARMTLRRVQNGDRGIARKEREISRYVVEIHKKFAFPVACLVFVLLGAPLATRVKRGGVGVGVVLSIIFFLLYYVSSRGGETLGDRGVIPAELGMWMANIVLGALGLGLVLHRDGRWPWRRDAS